MYISVTEAASAASDSLNVIPAEPVLQRMLAKYKDAPVIGLEFVAEVLRENREPIYHCFLCNANLESTNVISDVISAEHRLKYLVSGSLHI
jgi:hypothetical protein